MKFHKTERFMHMNDFILSCCSTADLTEEHFNSRNISYICFHYELNGKEYEDDLGIEFENGLMDDYRSCRNKCIFCFIGRTCINTCI